MKEIVRFEVKFSEEKLMYKKKRIIYFTNINKGTYSLRGFM
jgi:hypothetical protein